MVCFKRLFQVSPIKWITQIVSCLIWFYVWFYCVVRRQMHERMTEYEKPQVLVVSSSHPLAVFNPVHVPFGVGTKPAATK